MQRIPMPDGEMFAVSDRTILVDEIETIAAAGITLGREDGTLQIHLTAVGRQPRTQAPQDVTLAFSIDGALQLLDAVLHSLEAVKRATDEEGRS